MNVRSLRLTFECSFKHFLSGDIFVSIEFDDAAIVERVGVAWKNAFSTQARLRDRQIGASASSDLRNLRVFIYQNSKLIPCLSKPPACKLFVRSLESNESCRLILSRWSWLRRRRCRSDGANSSLLLRRFDPRYCGCFLWSSFTSDSFWRSFLRLRSRLRSSYGLFGCTWSRRLPRGWFGGGGSSGFGFGGRLRFNSAFRAFRWFCL